MSEVLEKPKADAASAAATAWLHKFESALTASDANAAANLFQTECYWRDLIAFTWNLTTQEGQPAITAMLDATLEQTRPRHWRLTEPATEDAGVITAWLAFETALGRGRGLVRLRDGLAWTLLTVLDELKGHEEHHGPTRDRGTEHGVVRERQSWLERRRAEEAELGITR